MALAIADAHTPKCPVISTLETPSFCKVLIFSYGPPPSTELVSFYPHFDQVPGFKLRYPRGADGLPSIFQTMRILFISTLTPVLSHQGRGE